VLQIALSVGFGSAEACAHAFRTRFGVSATRWRHEQRRKRDQVIRNADQTGRGEMADDFDSSFLKGPTMHVELVERDSTHIVYLRYVGPYGAPLAAFWQSRVKPWMTARALAGRPMIAIAHDNPNVTAPDKCRCDVGVEVDEAFVAVGDEHRTTVPGGRYATTRFFDTPARIADAWTALLRDWLPASGFQLDARPMFEYYPADARFDAATGAFECVITIPVAPL
jgi:AraC family transcriptional regulator